MTTIVYRDGVLAADSMSLAGNIIQPGSVIKIVRGPRGELGGACGSTAFCENWKLWVSGSLNEMPEHEGPVGDEGGDMGIVVHPDGRLELFEHNGSYFVDGPYFADGAGAAVAMGAMYMGATAEQAIRAAIKHDAFTGGEPTLLSLSAHAPDGASRHTLSSTAEQNQTLGR